ncbi:SMP-30/gluconolactonase/LRE family protein [Psychroflexus sp. YR1-1]|uniref:SMP-30/gluconolactonase/LRE family protein n=1 Tax=Psychroflexus aurantiacus TaxID=2709310 RepID=A0A6B3R701_9FLAO|nr:SMP-30/gluconolactonase/LRE family protein [Psychroflexus aurantiacus]NEV93581.1 SMP-30/gluconolactonase/LRE family protein [Psychroflexus aurantiacus]
MKLFNHLCFVLSAVTLLVSCKAEEKKIFGEPEVIASGFQFTEGPHWLEGEGLIFSDIPASKIYIWKADQDTVEVWLDPSGRSNGIDEMPNGDIIIAQHSGKISLVNSDKSTDVLVSTYKGKKLNSPNDLAITSAGVVYFTDPTYGVTGEPELDFSGVYQLKNDSLHLIYDEFNLPNGIALSVDERLLFAGDSETGDIIKFNLDEEGEVVSKAFFANIGKPTQLGAADGMLLDTDKRLYTTGPNGLMVFDESGTQIAQLKFDEQITNLSWGKTIGETLYITASDKVYRVELQN